MGYKYKYKTYYQDKPGSYKDYTPSYTTYQTDRPTSTYKPTQYSDNRGAYANDITAAKNALNTAISNKPGSYNSNYTGAMDTAINQMSNRKFSYDVNSDAMFQQLKSLYNEQGKQAMAETQGQAAALTGGYGNSYAAAAGQQAYQNSQEQLYNRIPELYQMALQQYQQEGSDLQNYYSMLSDRESSEYGKYRDTVSDWQADRSYYDTALNNLRSMNQSVWGQNEQNQYNANKQAWDNYITLSGMNDSNYWNAQNIATDRYKQALDNYWNGVDRTESAKQNAWNRASTDYWNRQNLNETSRHNKAGEKTDAYKAWTDRYNAYTDRYNAYSTRQHYNNSDATDYYSAQETSRHNKANESNDAYSNETARRHQRNSDETDRINARTNQNATTNNGTPNGGTSNNNATYKSAYAQANNGKNRFSNPGTQFSDKEYKGFRETVGKNRGTEGRCQLIEDAYIEGKITSDQAKKLLKNFGISEKKFAMYRGITLS